MEKKSLRERLLEKVQKTDSCWVWLGCINSNGYGMIHNPSGTKLAHRALFKELREDPGSLCVLHKCDNPRCVNPDHMFLGTMKDNTQDMLAKNRHNTHFGEKHSRMKISSEVVEEIRSSDLSLSKLVSLFGYSKSQISKIRSRKERVNG